MATAESISSGGRWELRRQFVGPALDCVIEYLVEHKLVDKVDTRKGTMLVL